MLHLVAQGVPSRHAPGAAQASGVLRHTSRRGAPLCATIVARARRKYAELKHATKMGTTVGKPTFRNHVPA
jgi:hypothetical protein